MAKVAVILIASAVLATAQVAHAVNRDYCLFLGDTSQLPWDEAPEWQRESIVKGVEFHVGNPDADASASHENWLEHKKAEGWVYGDVKDAEKKTHPCMVPFADLPKEQQLKDVLIKSIVHAAYPLFAGIASQGDGDGVLGQAEMTVDELMEHFRQGHGPVGAHQIVLQLDEASAQLSDLTARLEVAEKKAKAAKLSQGEKAAKPRKIGVIDKVLNVEDLRAAIAKAEKIEILFGDGKLESGPAPVLVEGDAWREHALGLMLTEPVTVHGPAQGQQPYQIAGAALLLDGKQVAWCQRPQPLTVAAGQKYGLTNDLFF